MHAVCGVQLQAETRDAAAEQALPLHEHSLIDIGVKELVQGPRSFQPNQMGQLVPYTSWKEVGLLQPAAWQPWGYLC